MHACTAYFQSYASQQRDGLQRMLQHIQAVIGARLLCTDDDDTILVTLLAEQVSHHVAASVITVVWQGRLA